MKQNLRQALIAGGWSAIDTMTSPLAYADTSGKRFGTLQKNEVRVALSIGEMLMDDRGTAVAFMSDEPSDVVLRALIVEPSARGKGLATHALTEIATLADQTVTTLYLEPAPIGDKAVTCAVLTKMYGRINFQTTRKGGPVMIRRPLDLWPQALSTIQAEHVQSTFPEAKPQMADYLRNSVAVTIERQKECGPDVPPIAIKVADNREFWIDCCETYEMAYARAKDLGLNVVVSG